jgi:hypothetical protein
MPFKTMSQRSVIISKAFMSVILPWHFYDVKGLRMPPSPKVMSD